NLFAFCDQPPLTDILILIVIISPFLFYIPLGLLFSFELILGMHYNTLFENKPCNMIAFL
ncbi:hypothetical protein RCU98_02595, partial [Escherichia coli]|nr:hypothetical protein [Escherichia coli]